MDDTDRCRSLNDLLERITLPPGCQGSIDGFGRDDYYLMVDQGDLPDSSDEGKTVPGGIGLDMPGIPTDVHVMAHHVIAALTISGLHEALEFVRADGQRVANPHPRAGTHFDAAENAMWNWLTDEALKLVDRYCERWPA